jgi:RNA recognition motif-containing protein
MKKLFVGNLAWATTSDDLRAFFASFGTVIDAVVLTDRMTGRSRGFGFVEMETEEQAQKALEANGKDLNGRNMNVNMAKPQENR